MLQIFLNIMMIYPLPLLAGFLFRFLLRKRKKAWLITAVAAVCTAVALIVALDPPVAGNEGYALRTVMLGCFTAACALTGLILRLVRKKSGR